MNRISSQQFAIFRIVFGIYLALHFAALAPYGAEVFSNRGLLAEARLNFTYGLFPNLLEHFESPVFVTIFLIGLSILSVIFAAGIRRRPAGVMLWYGWACLFNRNNLINNPSLPYVGLLLLLTIAVPAGESLRLKPAIPAWQFPSMAYWTAWIALAAGYSFSGWMKLRSPSWIDGSALLHVLNNPLARPGWARDCLLALPASSLRYLSWATVAAELLFLPLSLSQKTRMIAWWTLVAMNVTILFVINFADLTLGMLMVHLFTYDSAWHSIPNGARTRVRSDFSRRKTASPLAALVRTHIERYRFALRCG
jgi:hypothetical protein